MPPKRMLDLGLADHRAMVRRDEEFVEFFADASPAQAPGSQMRSDLQDRMDRPGLRGWMRRESEGTNKRLHLPLHLVRGDGEVWESARPLDRFLRAQHRKERLGFLEIAFQGPTAS